MRKSRFNEEQMVAILREAERASVAESAKKHKVSEASIFLGRQGFELSGSRTHRLWRQAGLLVPRKRPRRRVASTRPRAYTPFKANAVWAYDFVFDTTAEGRQIRLRRFVLTPAIIECRQDAP